MFKEGVLFIVFHLIPELKIIPIVYIGSECSGNWSQVIALLTSSPPLLAQDLTFNLKNASDEQHKFGQALGMKTVG